jgi:Ca2+-binding RTX toxin-like protein
MFRYLAIIAGALVATSGVALAENLRGTSNKDRLIGTPGADVIYAYAGDDAVYGGTGNDRIYGGTGKDHIWGGGGNDMIIGGPLGDHARSTPSVRHERIFGGGGNDKIVMRVAGSILFAGAGDDRIDVRDPASSCRVKPAQLLHAIAGARQPDTHARPEIKLDPPHCVQLVNTGPGNNFVRADDGNLDSLSCVGGRDRVVVDNYDVVPVECEVVRRVEHGAGFEPATSG